MAFTSDTGNNKQHINLSTDAYEVIRNDMFTFHENKLSHFINSIFEHYSPKAKCSISLVLNRYRGELSKLLSNIHGDEGARKRIFNRLISKEEEKLRQQTDSYEKGISFPFPQLTIHRAE